MSDQPEEHAGGFKYSKGGDFSLSPESWRDALAAIERMWDHTLVWCAKHPILFIIFLLFLLGAYWIRRRSKVDETVMKLEYERARSEAKGQMSLPLENPRRLGGS